MIIAQDLCGVGVLASGSIAGAYGAASMRVHAAQGPARARPALFATCGTVKTTGKSLTLKVIPTISKRLGEICGLAGRRLRIVVLMATAWPRVQHRIEEIRATIDEVQSGQVQEVPIPRQVPDGRPRT